MVTKSRKTNNQYHRILVLPRGTPRPCRDFMARTTIVVQRAASTVRQLCKASVPTFAPSRVHCCSELLAQVKQYLSTPLGQSEETQMAFQSIKKILPNSCKCLKGGLLSDLHSRLSRPPPSLPPGYLRFVREISKEIFTKGWDAAWSTKVSSFSPSLGSCIGKSRKHGGQLSTLAVDGQSAWQESLLRPRPGSLEGELLLVDSSGKPRPLTRFSSEAASLRPLHGLIYDHLSKFPWLLRGDVTAERLKEAGFDFSKSGEEPLTSGDYKSATDNLSIEVAESILDVAWSSSSYVPAPVFRFALAAQRPRLAYETDDLLVEHFVPTRGQMMGSYLCFPLLCLQNYIAFRYAESRFGCSGTPVLINGDDILFQSPRAFSEEWMSVVGGLGLEVEKTKTSVSCEFGSLNSTLVRWKGGNLVVVRTLRLGMLRECSHPGNLGTSAAIFSRVGPRESWMANCLAFLSWHQHTIVKWNAVASDMGFQGRLLRRAFERFRGGRLLWRDDVLHQMRLDRLPSAPCPHNVVMRSQEFVNVKRQEVSKDISRETCIWMASRKWELGRGYMAIKPTKLVHERAKATRVPAWLNRYDTKPEVLKRESARVLVRTEYYFTDSVSGPRKRPLRVKLPGQSKPSFLSESLSISTRRSVPLERTWWSPPCSVDEVRIPKSIWEAHHPPHTFSGMSLLANPSSVPYVDVVKNLVRSETQGDEIFYSRVADRTLLNSGLSCFRQFWALNE
uniref:RNA-dependent RNA polymerase n=1 Tax=Lianyungang Botou tick virus 1 TaxID=2972045 RepID=A0A9E7V224_9VIRU|nr:MAG: RNA-dependent RNA polymerase [Lianyungang Botou tick virus 1]